MGRSIMVSTAVYAAIWASRKPGEDDENAVLARVLECEGQVEGSADNGGSDAVGFRDSRNGVSFRDGFEIFRHYKRREYRARARNGAWVRQDNGKSYASLNQLNGSIASGQENVWNGNWKFRDPDGSIRSIDDLRKKQ